MKVRRIVLPGEFLSEVEGRRVGKNVYVEGEKAFSKVIGIPKLSENEISIIALEGVYYPNYGDKVIAKVVEVEAAGWIAEILNSPYRGYLPIGEAVKEYVDILKTDLSKYYDEGELIYCKISKVTKDKTIVVSLKDEECRKLVGGALVTITPSKVARVIGKGGSMINLLKTCCEILVGQNGAIWVKGEKMRKVIEAILTIEKESQFYGLTEKIQEMLKNERKN